MALNGEGIHMLFEVLGYFLGNLLILEEGEVVVSQGILKHSKNVASIRILQFFDDDVE